MSDILYYNEYTTLVSEPEEFDEMLIFEEWSRVRVRNKSRKYTKMFKLYCYNKNCIDI